MSTIDENINKKLNDKLNDKFNDKFNDKLNIYAKNMLYIEQENKKYLSKLTDFINDNEWLKISKTPFNTEYFEVFNKIKNIKEKNYNKHLGLKPGGVWFSKGGWLFHEDMCCNIDNYIIIAQIDYSNIYRITGSNRFNNPMNNKKYISSIRKFDKIYNGKIMMRECIPKYTKSTKTTKSSKYKNTHHKINCKTIKTSKKCNKFSQLCQWFEGFNFYNWAKLYKEYDGFALYPYMSKEFMLNIQKHLTFTSWDVESLVLWSAKPIIKYKTLGTIKEIIDDERIDSNNPLFYRKLVEKLKEKINEWRNE